MPSDRSKRTTTDRHALYEAAVQNVEADIDFLDRAFRRRRRRAPKRLREDFCGSASLACRWVRGASDRFAWGVDLDRATLSWGRRHRVAPLGGDATRVTLACADVRTFRGPEIDAVTALNFSYSVFRRRPALLDYFRNVRRSLGRDGAFLLDVFGGTGAMQPLRETSRKPASTEPDGRRTPPFTYSWEQVSFNPVDHRLRCRIRFRLGRVGPERVAFRYDWRLWSIPEIRDLLEDAGFSSSDVFVEGWDNEAWESNGVFRRTNAFENQEGWLAYVIGWA